MKIGIVYFSGTGNTKKFAREISDSFNQLGASSEIIPVSGDLAIDSFDIVGVCFPVYAWAAPWMITHWIKRLQKQNSKKAFIYVTYAGKVANAITRTFRLMTKKGFDVRNWGMGVAEETWTVLRTPEKLAEIAEKQKKKVSNDPMNFATKTLKIASGKTEKKPAPESNFSWHDLIVPFYTRTWLWTWFRVKVDKNKCTKCGVCASVCPTGCITLDPFPKIKAPCSACYGCINHCPEEALDSLGTKGKMRCGG